MNARDFRVGQDAFIAKNAGQDTNAVGGSGRFHARQLGRSKLTFLRQDSGESNCRILLRLSTYKSAQTE